MPGREELGLVGVRNPDFEGRPGVSVGLPVYNGEAYVGEAIQSVLRQTYRDFELIVSDNGSTDRTEDIVLQLAATDSRVRYRRHAENIGAHRNYNSIVPMAQAELFKWIAHDDVLEPTFLEACVAALEGNPDAGLVFSQADVIDASGAKIGSLRSNQRYDSSSPYRRLRAFVAAPTRIPQVFGVMRRSVLDQTPLLGSYPKSDIVFMYEMAMRTRWVVVDDPLMLSREHRERLGARPLRNRTDWYHPDREAPMLPRWSQLSGFMRACWRVEMPLTDKLKCLAFAGYWGARHSGELFGDLVHRVRHSATKLRDRDQ